MNWNDYEAVWKRQELPVGPDADLAALKETFETKRRKLAATLLIRDWTEISACVVVVAFYAWFWRSIGPSGWPMAIAMLLILGVAGVFLRERRRTRRKRVGADAPLLAKIEADLGELHHQRQLLLNVWAWYLAPCAGAVLIQVGVMIRRAKPWEATREPLVLLGLGLCLALFLWFAWAINGRAVRKQIEPRLDELEKLRRDILSPN
jgi:hypothetical protein